MFRTRILLQRIKHSTGLVGLPVVPNAREVLAELYNTTLINIQVKLIEINTKIENSTICRI